MKTRVAFLLCVLLAAAAPAEEADSNVLEIYPVEEGSAEALVEMARSVAGPEAQVTLDPRGQRVLVLTTRERQAQVAEIFRPAAVAPFNVRLDVRFRGAGSAERSGAEVGIEGGIVHGQGLNNGTIRIRPRVENSLSTHSRDTVQTLVVANGRSASLRVGEDVPYLTWILDYGRRHHLLVPEVAWQQVGSFLAVEVQVMGEGPMIRLRITPELRGLVDGRPERARFASVSTEVVVQEGQPFPLGGLADANEFFSRFLVGAARGGTQEALDISVTAHILRAP